MFFCAAGISATSEDIPNKIEDLRSECSSDFGGKDSVTSPDGEEAGHGRRMSHQYQCVCGHQNTISLESSILIFATAAARLNLSFRVLNITQSCEVK